MKLKVMAMALAAGLTVTALPGVIPQNFGNVGFVAEAASVQEFNVPVTLQHHENPENKSMGNAALIQLGKVVVDSEGKAALQLTFHSLTISGSGTGYLGWLKKVNSDGTMTDAKVIEEYTNVTDIYNDEEGDDFDDQLHESADGHYWYPKVVSIPVEAKYDSQGNIIGITESRIEVQVHVPIMEKLNESGGGGTQFAYLDVKNGLFTGSSVSLDGNVNLNTYFNFSDAFLNDSGSKVVISTEDGRSDTVYVKDVKAGTETNQYFVATRIPAKDMTTNLSAELIDGSGNVVDTFTTNVSTYAKSVISSDADEKYKVLAAEMLNYGSRAQVYFDYKYDNNDKNLANNGVAKKRKDTYKNVEADAFTNYTYSASGSMNGLSYYGTALSFLSETTMRHYFKLNSGDIKNHTFKIGDSTLNAKYDSEKDLYYVDIKGINAKDLDKDFVLNVDGTYTLTYSALDYCNLAVSGDTKNKMKNLAKALYKFWEAAENI